MFIDVVPKSNTTTGRYNDLLMFGFGKYQNSILKDLRRTLDSQCPNRLPQFPHASMRAPQSSMRERITFVHGAEAAFDPKQLKVDKEAVRVQSLKASREDRLTFSISELPQEVLHHNAGRLQNPADSSSYIAS